VQLAGARQRVGRRQGLVERPGEVDRGRPRAAQELGARGAVVGEREAVGGGYADRGRAPHGQRPDAIGDLGRSGAAQPALLARQRALVEHP